MVSIYENMSFRLFSSFLTAGNKSKCGTLRRLTDPQQSTVGPIFRPVSPRKRQVMQGKPFALSPISTQTSSHLRKHRTSVPPAKTQDFRPICAPDAHRRSPTTPRCAPIHTHTRTPAAPPDAPLPPHPQPNPHPHPSRSPRRTPLPKSACNSRTGVTQ